LDYQLVTTDEALAEFCRLLSDASYCAIDTEFVREKTYYPLLSLIQIATEKHMACIDPLAIGDLSPLLALLKNPDIVKVFHSPSQDLEILYQQFATLPDPVFDTQLAAAVLGYTHQISYAELVSEITGVKLEKKHTRADWSRRPLSSSELDYAMDDVKYLLPVYRHLNLLLHEKGRYGWIKQDLANLSLDSNFHIDTSSLWKRLKGVQKLKGVELQIAQDLCAWREEVAQRKNLPRRWVTADDWIIEIAKMKPADLAEFDKIRAIPDKALSRNKKTWLELVDQALAKDASGWPVQHKPQKLDSHQQALADCLMALCREIADKNGMALATLVTRKDLDSLILNRKSSRLAKGWHFEIIGQHLLDFIYGQSSITVENDRIQVVAKSLHQKTTE
jgi:ribonuclease D